jgi:hypothetical protein
VFIILVFNLKNCAMVFKISLSKLLTFVTLLIFVCVACVFGQDLDVLPPVVPDHTLFSQYWPVFALAVSEVLAFLPSKWSGIGKVFISAVSAVYTVLTKKKGVSS